MGQPSQFEEDKTSAEDSPGTESAYIQKRFYRDPENKIISGVCGGISAYFHWDPVILRILFLISVFAGGFGVLLYLVLWVVIPEARTTAEKLQMRGEQVNISTIQQSIQEEVSGLKDQFQNLTRDAKEKFTKGSPFLTPFEQILKGIGEVLRFAGRILLIILGAILVLMGISFFIFSVALLYGWGGPIMMDTEFMVMSFPSYLDMLLSCSFNPFFLQVALLILIGIPFLMILYSGIRLLFRFERIKYLGITVFNIWLIGLVITIFYSFKIYNLVKVGNTDKQMIQITQPVSDTITFLYGSQKYPGSVDTYEVVDNILISRDKEGNVFLNPVIRVEKSDNSMVEITEIRNARGKTFSEAKMRSGQISYNFLQSGDTIWFDPLASFPQKDCWRGQEIKIIVKVPSGKVILFGPGRWKIQSEDEYLIREIDERTYLKSTASGLTEID